MIALAAGAERGVGVTAAAVAIGIGLLIALTARWPAGDSKLRLMRWAVRLVAAGLVACGVIVCVDGVFDV